MSGQDRKFPPAPGTNQIAGFGEFRPLTSQEKNKRVYFLSVRKQTSCTSSRKKERDKLGLLSRQSSRPSGTSLVMKRNFQCCFWRPCNGSLVTRNSSNNHRIGTAALIRGRRLFNNIFVPNAALIRVRRLSGGGVYSSKYSI